LTLSLQAGLRILPDRIHMAFVVIGCVLVLLKLLEIGAVGDWSWWTVVAPFGVAAVWWAISDATGGTKRRAMAREDKRVAARRARHLKAMGLDTFGSKTVRRPPPDGPSS
jgi:small Trp-rich protein